MSREIHFIEKPLIRSLTVIFLAVVLSSAAWLRGEDAVDPFVSYLDGKAPEILREIPGSEVVPGNITLRRIVFRSRNDTEIFAVIASPSAPGNYPGLLVLHGGGGSAEVDKAMAWAQRGYVAVAPDLPGIAEPGKTKNTRGPWSDLKYGDGRWIATSDASASVIFDAVLSAMKSLDLLRSQPNVDGGRIGVVGISWGGYMTTMVCGLAGDRVRAGFALYGCGFFDLGSMQQRESYNPKLPRSNVGRMPQSEQALWLRHLDAGRRAPGIKAVFFHAAATHDFFGYPRSVQATLDAISGEKNQVFAPNANHNLPVPGGSVFEKASGEIFTPTAFQPYPTPRGQKANWLGMEVPYFDYLLKGVGKPFPVVSLQSSETPGIVRFTVKAPHPLGHAQVYWSKASPALARAGDVTPREWIEVQASLIAENAYEAKLPHDAAEWFALVSDNRPVSVSSQIVHRASSEIIAPSEP
jgi:dienelactone hydrolase